MEFDPKYAQERFRGLTREEVVEELALHTDQYVPMALKLLEGEALDRGITKAEIEARRDAARTPKPRVADTTDAPALLTSAMDRAELEPLAASLQGEGVPAVVAEVDTRRFHGSGCTVGRWGLFVPGRLAAEAGRHLDAVFPLDAAPGGAACGGGCGGGSCGAGDDDPAALEPGDWDEDGDWWKTGAPGEDEP
jgi:hypothetical protein